MNTRNATPKPSPTELMREAIAASRQALEEGNFPYGAVLASAEGERLFCSRNNQVSSGDCTGHAEIVLIREVTDQLGADKLRGATVYASGEPCAMCSGALFWAGVSKVVYAMSQDTIMRVGGGDTLSMRAAAVFATASRPIAVEGPLLEAEAAAVLQEMASRG